MNPQLNHVLAGKGTVTRLKSLQHPGRRVAVRVLGALMILVIFAVLALTASAGTAAPLGQLTEFSTGLAGSYPEWIAAAPDGNLWFTDNGDNDAVGRITPSGQITDFSTGLNPRSEPNGITAGPDGNLWFADPEGAIGRIGSGAPRALDAPASVSGAGAEGSAEACDTLSSAWAGCAPSALLYPFDGYSWSRDGTAIAGQTAPTYIPTAGDVGHRLGCRMPVTYPLPFSVTATAPSPAVTIKSAPPPPPPPTPALSALDITPRMFTLTGRRLGGRCRPSSRLNRRERPCIRPVMLHGTSVINGGAGADTFIFMGKIGGRALGPGNHRVLAMPTIDGIAGQQQRTTFEMTR